MASRGLDIDDDWARGLRDQSPLDDLRNMPGGLMESEDAAGRLAMGSLLVPLCGRLFRTIRVAPSVLSRGEQRDLGADRHRKVIETVIIGCASDRERPESSIQR